MTLHRTLAMASAITMALSLAGCGGGSSEVVSAPPPVGGGGGADAFGGDIGGGGGGAVTITAPAAASAPAAPAFPQAVAGGPTIAAPGSALLPLLQTVQVSNATGSTIAPDTATMNAGATLTLGPGASRLTFNIANSALGVSNTVLTQSPGQVYVESSGSTVIRLDYAALDWTAFGFWDVYPGGVNPVTTSHHSQFVTGFQTPGSAVPTTGSASYTGDATGQMGDVYLSGTANMQANFANGTIAGSLSGMITDFDSGSLPWNSVSLSASFAGGQSRFSGTTAVTSAPANSPSLKANATGTVVGSFFGPAAQELGAVWTLFDGTRAAAGSIGAKKGP